MRNLVIFILLLGSVRITSGQDIPGTKDKGKLFTIISYNVENLFDTLDDPATRDEEFTSDGAKN